MQEKGNKCNPFQLKDEGVEVKGKTGPGKSSRERYMSCDACNADSRREGEREGAGSKIIQNKNKFFFHTSAKKTSCFSFFRFLSFFFLINKPVVLKER